MLILTASSARRRPASGTVLIADTAIPGTNARSDDSNAVLISGLSADSVIRISKRAGMTYQAWSPWFSDTDPGAGGLPWQNRLQVTDGSGVITPCWAANFANPGDAEQYAIANPIQLTGSTSYRLWLSDPAPSDNRGGLSVIVTQLRKPGAIA